MIVFDIEANGLLDTVTKIYCLVAEDTDTGEVKRWRGDGIPAGIAWLFSQPEIAGHNIIGYDLEALLKVYGAEYTGKTVDTLILSKLCIPDLRDQDFERFRKKLLPGHLIGRHGLEAWGHRLGIHKGDYGKQKADDADDGRPVSVWDEWSQEMEDYCAQDVEVNHKLYEYLKPLDDAPLAHEIEHSFAHIIARMHRRGVHFDVNAAEELYVRLARERNELSAKLKEHFGSWQKYRDTFIPKVNNKARGYVKGVPIKRYDTVEFKPTSPRHIADRLIEVYGWEPQVLSESKRKQMRQIKGEAAKARFFKECVSRREVEVKDITLKHLPYPIVADIRRFLLLQKRISMLAEGDGAWLKKHQGDRIYGEVDTLGTVTGRCAHKNPNMGQIPAVKSEFGKECRELFKASEGYSLVGCDAEACQLRCLAHFLHTWDDGAYGIMVSEGKSEDGTDIHTRNWKDLGLPNRDAAKTFIYKFLFGAGDAAIGLDLGGDVKLGAQVRAKFYAANPALEKMIEAITYRLQTVGYLRGVDGRRYHIRSPHVALVTLVQGTEAIIMKQAMVLADAALMAKGLVPVGKGGDDYEFVLMVHDEFQVEAKRDAESVGKTLADAITKAAEKLGIKCKMDGGYKVGSTWADTH